MFDIVCGTSIGAINAALLAQGEIDALARLWHGIAERKIIQYIPQVHVLKDMIATVGAVNKDNALKKIGDLIHLWHDYRQLGPVENLMGLRGLVSPDPIVRILQDNLDWNKLAASSTSLVVTGTNLTRGTTEGFYRFSAAVANVQQTFANKPGANRHPLREDIYVDAVRSSAAIPGAFAPVSFAPRDNNSYDYVDGGVANNTPIGLAIDAGATEVTVVFMDPSDTKPRQQTINNLAQIAFASYDVMQQKILEDDLKLANAVNNLETATRIANNKIQIALWYVRPQAPLALSVLGFDNQTALNAAFAQGLLDGTKPVRL
jgi:predicted acylesterase/phospholipase RssA